MNISDDLDTGKTIIIPFDDVNMILKYCNDSEGHLSKDFFDWYLKEDSFFIQSGLFILEANKEHKIYLIFDFNDVEGVFETIILDEEKPDSENTVFYIYTPDESWWDLND